MSLPYKETNPDDTLGLLQYVQDLLQTQSLFLNHLSIEEFATNKKLYSQIFDHNNEMKRVVEILMSAQPSVKVTGE